MRAGRQSRRVAVTGGMTHTIRPHPGTHETRRHLAIRPCLPPITPSYAGRALHASHVTPASRLGDVLVLRTSACARAAAGGAVTGATAQGAAAPWKDGVAANRSFVGLHPTRCVSVHDSRQSPHVTRWFPIEVGIECGGYCHAVFSLSTSAAPRPRIYPWCGFHSAAAPRAEVSEHAVRRGRLARGVIHAWH
jgi:hypothetical protein